MKTSKIRGFIKDLENKNKNFSFNKTMKLLDASNEIYIDIIKKQDFKNVTNYNNSKYLFKEITNELIEITELLNKGKTLMAVCLLRNVYEEIMYVMATSCSEEKIDIDAKTCEIKIPRFEDDIFLINNLLQENQISLIDLSFENEDLEKTYISILEDK